MRTVIRYACLVILSMLVPDFLAAQQNHATPPPTAGVKERRGRELSRELSRARWFLRGRTLPGRSSAALRYQAYLGKMRLRAVRVGLRQSALVPFAASGGAVWTPLGPAPLTSDASGNGQQDYGWVAGRATAVAIDHSDASGNTVYLGSATGGVWKSSNAGSPDPAGVTWTPLTDDQPTLAIGALAIQPQPPASQNPLNSLILAGTGETNSSVDSYYGLGILRSADAGKTWTLITQDTAGHSFSGLGFSKIVFSSADPNLTVAAAASTSQGEIENRVSSPAGNLGLYYSPDGGITWSYAIIEDGTTAIPSSSATTVVFNQVTGTFFAAIRFHGIYSSPDGKTWTRLANQPGAALTTTSCPATPTSSGCPLYRAELAAVPGRNEMYAWFVDSNNNDQGIWKSVNSGSSWNQISDTSITACGDLLGGCGTENGTYSFALAAIPGPTGQSSDTDLYAGAVNLYKCSITAASPSCNGPKTFLNLTHVYGCAPDFGALAHVHPDQHSLDLFVDGNGHSHLYLANDGGIYRGLDAYTGLLSGDCGTPNQFDNLNQNLGSLTQFLSFAQDPAAANTIFGGAEGNGSPATAQALSSTVWTNVNSGDGGYSEINPANPDEWFTSSPGVNIQHCEFGIECHAEDFAAGLVVSSPTLNGDAGPFYTPYLLDPQNPDTLLVGSCRVWRGTSDGAGFAALSDNFDTGSDSSCAPDSVNFVRSLAAGGPRDSNRQSSVIYAGSDGVGPLASKALPGGRLWVTTSAEGGPSSWAERTAAINPNHFPISSIAIDAADPTGQTAYVGIMGFGSPHVWMTPSAGQSWVDFTGNLPDAPVDALLVDAGVDPQSGTLYAATDVGVFATSTASPGWTEVGPAPAAATTGYLPDVPVTALRIFSNGPTKLLRASTYGRGVWQFPLSTIPDFQVAMPDPAQTVFASQTAQFSGALTAFNNYNSAVQLTCTPAGTTPPAVCNASPANPKPAAAGAKFTVSAAATAGDYAFKLHAAGTDPSAITHDVALALHVIDFGLSPPSPASLTVNRSDSSAPIALQVTAAGRFAGQVSLACTGLPTGGYVQLLAFDCAQPDLPQHRPRLVW